MKTITTNRISIRYNSRGLMIQFPDKVVMRGKNIPSWIFCHAIDAIQISTFGRKFDVTVSDKKLKPLYLIKVNTLEVEQSIFGRPKINANLHGYSADWTRSYRTGETISISSNLQIIEPFIKI